MKRAARERGVGWDGLLARARGNSPGLVPDAEALARALNEILAERGEPPAFTWQESTGGAPGHRPLRSN